MTAPRLGRVFRAYLLPGIVFQSVLIGGAYATGREIVEYGAQYGAAGVWCIVALGLGFSVMAVLTFEFARRHRTYDYRSFMQSLVGPFWPLFDVIYAVMVLVTVAVVIAASVRVAESVLGLPETLSIAVVIVLVVVLEVGGRRQIERFKTLGSVVLYFSFAVFAGVVLAGTWENVQQVFQAAQEVEVPQIGVPALLFVGVLYVGYNLGAMPATLFVLDDQHRFRHTLLAGIVTGVMATVPFVLTYLALMGHYTTGDVLLAEVPWLEMLPGNLTAVYAVVILWTLVETSTGMLHAVIQRVDTHLYSTGRRRLTRVHTGLLTAAILVAAVACSRFGIIALVSRGYGTLAYGFLLLFAAPLLFRLLTRRL